MNFPIQLWGGGALSDDVSGLSSEHESGGQILEECRKK